MPAPGAPAAPRPPPPQPTAPPARAAPPRPRTTATCGRTRCTASAASCRASTDPWARRSRWNKTESRYLPYSRLLLLITIVVVPLRMDWKWGELNLICFFIISFGFCKFLQKPLHFPLSPLSPPESAGYSQSQFFCFRVRGEKSILQLVEWFCRKESVEIEFQRSHNRLKGAARIHYVFHTHTHTPSLCCVFIYSTRFVLSREICILYIKRFYSIYLELWCHFSTK